MNVHRIDAVEELLDDGHDTDVAPTVADAAPACGALDASRGELSAVTAVHEERPAARRISTVEDLDAAVLDQNPDLILVDLSIQSAAPTQAANIRAGEILKDLFRHRPVLLCGFARDLAEVTAAIGGGARGFLRSQPPVLLCDTAFQAAAPGWRPTVVLTSLQLQVVQGMAKGYSNTEIGAAVGRTEDAIKTQARGIFRVLGARDRSHAVLLCLRARLIN